MFRRVDPPATVNDPALCENGQDAGGFSSKGKVFQVILLGLHYG
jgi:hypothetical protein